MTRVIFYKSNGIYYGFDVQGHTGLADAGEDILCAAISSMTMLVINALESSYHSSVNYTVDDEDAHITLVSPDALGDEDTCVSFAVRGLIEAYCEQLIALEEDYGDFLSVDVVEKDLQ